MKFAIPAVPPGLSPGLSQWCQGVTQLLQVIAGMLGPDADRAVRLGEVAKLTGTSVQPTSGNLASIDPGQAASVWLPSIGTWTLMAVTGSGGTWSGMIVWTGGVGSSVQTWGATALEVALLDGGELRLTNQAETAVSLRWTVTSV